MSRIGKSPIKIPEGVSVQAKDDFIFVKGPKGELQSILPNNIKLEEKDAIIRLERTGNEPSVRSLHGTAQVLLKNNIHGVSQGWEKILELIGVGYRVQIKEKTLVFSLGYSHDLHYLLPNEIEAIVKDQTKITLKSIDKQKLGQTASEIRNLRPPEPYKGKGVRYADEHIVRKAGKSTKK